jgi:alpha-L-fucosidase
LRRLLVLGVALALAAGLGALALRPPFPAVSEERAAAVRRLRCGLFVCWSLSTFSDQEWTRGVTDLAYFAPTGFDPDGWARAARAAGMNYLLLLTKHHDGFCLWDTDTTGRKVTRSPLRRDVVAEVRQACARHGLKLALYYSEGDWTWPGNRDAARKGAQLRELLTRYGPVEFLWLDHAIGDGGLDHAATTRLVKSLQPGCLVGYSGGQAGGDLRVGEYGHAAPLTDPSGAGFGHSAARRYRHYRAAEFSFPIFNGLSHRWFYPGPRWDGVAHPVEALYRAYAKAALHDNLFSLAVAPDRSGRLRPVDEERLRALGRLLRHEAPPPPLPVSEDRLAAASSSAGPGHQAGAAVDGKRYTRWQAAAGARAGWLRVDLGGWVLVSRAVIEEGAARRVRGFVLEYADGPAWRALARGEGIGPRLELRFGPVWARVLRLRITDATDAPSIQELQLYGTPSGGAGERSARAHGDGHG